MPILTIEEARQQCRVGSDHPEDDLLPHIHGAEKYVVAHLNRAVFPDKQALEEAQNLLAAEMGAAFDEYRLAMDSARTMSNPAQRQTTISLAETKYAKAQLQAQRVINGIAIEGTSIKSAILLTLGNLFAHRETDVIGVTVAALPTGVPELLRSHRMVQMP